jgi:hypothetical protein
VDTLKRVRPKRLTLFKWSRVGFFSTPKRSRTMEHSSTTPISVLHHTPKTDPYLQALSAEIDPSEVKHSMMTIGEAGRKTLRPLGEAPS